MVIFLSTILFDAYPLQSRYALSTVYIITMGNAKNPCKWHFHTTYKGSLSQKFAVKFTYAFICFANFPVFVFRSYIPGTMYFTGFAVIFDCSKPAAFQPYPPNFILRENSFCFLKFPISDFSNLGDSHFLLGGGNLGVKFFPQKS